MENFDREPQSFTERAFIDIQEAAVLKGYEINMIENRADEIRFQILRNEQNSYEEKSLYGFGEKEHEEFLKFLFETSELVTPQNAQIKVHPNHAINIIITPQ